MHDAVKRKRDGLTNSPRVPRITRSESLASPSPSVVVVLSSFNGVARQSRRGAARSRLIIAFPACRRRACRIGCRPLLVCRGCTRLRVGQSLLLPLETRRVGAVRAPRSSRLAWRLSPSFWLRRMASSRLFQLLRRQWAFLAPQPSEDLLSLQLCFVCLELLFVGPVSGVGGGACALCMFLQ